MDADRKLRFIVTPLLAFGHMCPLFEFSRRLAEMGHHVSFLALAEHINTLAKAYDHLPSALNLVRLTLPPIDGPLKEVQGSMDASINEVCILLKRTDDLEGQLHAFIEANERPDWLINDTCNYKATTVASKYGIPSVHFGAVNAVAHCIYGPPGMFGQQGGSLEQWVAPPPWVKFPTTVAFKLHEASYFADLLVSHDKFLDVPMADRFRTPIQACEIAAIRSCMEVEGEWLKLLGELYQKPVLPIGLLTPPLPKKEDPWEDKKWLDSQKQGSVVYVGFGTQVILSREQLHELAFGLELSGLPFFWCYTRGDPSLLPSGFEERTKGRGLFKPGWVPQARLLSHPSVGCFFMHGGWGSSMEGLARGKPLVMLPKLADQALNTRLLCEKKLGIEVPTKDIDGTFTQDDIAKCLKLVMVEEEGAAIRTNVREMMKVFNNENRDRKLMEDFVKYLIEHSRKRSVSASLA